MYLVVRMVDASFNGLATMFNESRDCMIFIESENGSVNGRVKTLKGFVHFVAHSTVP